jgi:hypothetical protein
MAFCPNEWFAFSSKVKEWPGEFGVVLDESSIEVTEAKEFLDIFNGFGSWPIVDCFKFDWVYL